MLKRFTIIDLFDPALPVLQEKIIEPGQQAYLYDLSRLKDKGRPAILCAAGRAYDEKRTPGHYAFIVKSPLGTQNVMRILLPAKPLSISVNDIQQDLSDTNSNEWDASSHTCLLKFINDNKGVSVKISY